ncbi:MAG: hypothetical protein F4X29_04425 [Rhodothermaceae bacterium]|nr:hypothetical protein [Rhodothermaceae bacterium]
MYLHLYYDLNGDYNGIQIFWALVVTMLVAFGVYLYIPAAKKVKRGGLIWTFGLCFSVILAVYGITMNEISAWRDHYGGGFSFVMFALYIPAIHLFGQNWDKRYEWPFFKRPRKIGEGSGQLNKTEA